MSIENWRTSLAELFGGYVKHDTLEAAAESMVFVSADSDRHHDQFLMLLEEGTRAAHAGDDSVLSCINRSAYQVTTAAAAASLLDNLRQIYLKEYERSGSGV